MARGTFFEGEVGGGGQAAHYFALGLVQFVPRAQVSSAAAWAT
jgi:hypothetical protein